MAASDSMLRFLAAFVDEDYYLRIYPDVATARLSPVRHYFEFGWKEDRSPNPLFVPSAYKKQLAGNIDIPVLAHYLAYGATTSLRPHPLFDRSYYLQRYPGILESNVDPFIFFFIRGLGNRHSPHPLFDTDFYIDQIADDQSIAGNPLSHYLQKGWKERINPHPLFDTTHYLAQAEPNEVIDEPVLVHYLQYGAQARRSPHPLFDPKYYCEQAGQVTDALQHFLREGWRQGYNPHPKFDTQYYLQQNPDVAEAGMNPLVHFILHGAEEKRSPCKEYTRSFMMGCGPEGSLPRWRMVLDTAAVPNISISDFLKWRYESAGSEWILSDPRLKNGFDDHAELTSRTINALIAEINDVVASVEVRPKVDVSIIVPVHNKLIHTLACLRSIFNAGSRYSFEVLVADDASTDATQTTLAKLSSPHLKTFRSESAQGFLGNCNGVAVHAKGDWLVLLNNDTIVLPGWLDELIGTLDGNAGIGLVGAKLLYPDGSLQESGGVVWRDANAWNIGRGLDPRMPQFSYLREVDYCSGAVIALSRSLWERFEGFDQRYSPAYYEDTDLAFRIKEAGYQVVVQPLACVVHFEGVSHGKEGSSGVKKHQEINRQTFLKRWNNALIQHPCVPGRVKHEAIKLKMKAILVVDAETPRPDHDSGSNDTFQYIRALLQFGYQVIFVAQNCLYLGRYTQNLQRLGVECYYAPYVLSLQQVVKEQGARLAAVLVFRHYVAQELLQVVKEFAPRAKVVLETVDLHLLREGRQAKLNQDQAEIARAEKTKQTELAIIDQVDATILLSEHEKRLVRKLKPKANLHCIPILREMPTLPSTPLGHREGLIFLGGFRHPPNVDGICWFVKQVWPLLMKKGFGGKLLIIGANPTADVMSLESWNISVLGHVEMLDPVFAMCRATIAPLRYGAGLKGKVISSLSYGVPCVSTPIGVEGSGLKHEQNVLVGESASEFAAQILRIYSDDSLWSKLSQNGRQFFEKRFSVQAVFPRIQKLFRQLGV